MNIYFDVWSAKINSPIFSLIKKYWLSFFFMDRCRKKKKTKKKPAINQNSRSKRIEIKHFALLCTKLLPVQICTTSKVGANLHGVQVQFLKTLFTWPNILRPIDARCKIWEQSASWLQKRSCLKIFTMEGRRWMDGRTPGACIHCKPLCVLLAQSS